MSIEKEQPRETLEETITRLAELSPLKYDQVRKLESKKLNIRISTLDDEVQKARCVSSNEKPSAVEELEPFDESLSTDELLTEISNQLSRHVFLPAGAITALSLWCLGTFSMNAWQLWPKCLITSPEKRCGKTTLVEAMEGLTYRSLVVSNISPSAIFRIIEDCSPTLYMDESDTFLKDNPEMNGIMNAGHKRRNAKVIRSEKQGETFVPVTFNVFGAQVISGIGSQRDTLHDRSIHIEMERKLPDEPIFKLPVNFFEQNEELRRKCIKWSLDNTHKLKFTNINTPNYGNDRAQDNWEPLLKIANDAGNFWMSKALDAYQLFASKTDDYEDAGILLLRDIKTILKDKNCSRISSSDLVGALILIEESPWFEWKKGHPITQNSLSRLLKPFKIKPSKKRGGKSTFRGYTAKQFHDVFERYVSDDVEPENPKKSISSLYPPNQSGTVEQTSCDAGCSPFQSGTQKENVPLSKPLKRPPDAGCSTVPLEKGGIEGNSNFLDKNGKGSARV